MSEGANPGAETLDLDELRARRLRLQKLDDVVSYVRRVAQGRADVTRAALNRRRGDSAAEPVELAGELRDVLADRLVGGPPRPPRPVEDFSEHPRAAELDRLCADHGYGRLDELDAEALVELSAALDEFERRVSTERQQVFAELDTLSEELVRRYQEREEATPSGGAERPGGGPAGTVPDVGDRP